MTSRLVTYSPDVREALTAGRPIVALETTIVAHGFPPGEGLAVGQECERRVRDGGAVPATVAVMDGALHVGLDDEQLERIAAAGVGRSQGEPARPRRLHRRRRARRDDRRRDARRVPPGRHPVMATGGIGGVHRGYATRPDISADLAELARTPAVVVCSGVKSLLDVPATIEALETLGVPVVGFGTDTVPLFYAATGGPPAPIRADTAEDVARIAQTHWALGLATGVVVARPPDPEVDVTELIEEALGEAEVAGRLGPGGDAVRPLAPPRAQRRPDARGQPPAGGGQRGARRRDRRRV